MEPSATSTTVIGPVEERPQAGTEDTPSVTCSRLPGATETIL